MADGGSTEVVFNYTYTHGVDEKRRVQIPSNWRPSESNVVFTLMVWPARMEGTCLRGLPPKKLAEMIAKLNAMPDDDESKPVMKRTLGSNSAQVTLDKAGRMVLPEEMARAAGITDEVVLVGTMDCFELWEPKCLERIKAADAVIAASKYKKMLG